VGGWLTPRPDRFPPGSVYEVGWARGPVWMWAENLVPTGIRSPDGRPISSRYTDYVIPAHHNLSVQSLKKSDFQNGCLHSALSTLRIHLSLTPEEC